MKKINWDSDKALSISAFVVSIATLLALLYQVQLAQNQADLLREEQKASVLPYVDIWIQNLNDSSFSLSLVNNGLGSAFVEEIAIRYQEKLYAMDPAIFSYNVAIKEDTLDFYYANISEGRAIPAGKEVNMIGILNSKEDADLLRKWFSAGGKAKVIIKYSSIYGDQGVSSIPQPVIPQE